MKLAVSFGGYYSSAKKYVEASKFCEAHGLESVWFADSQMIHRDVYICMALCADHTSKIKLGTAVTNPITREITITAGAICTLNEISNGRAILGIGPGDSSVRRIGRSPATVSKLEKNIHELRKICSGEPLSYPNGETVAMRWASGMVPIFISATGKRMLELAGRIGDGVIINVGTSEASLQDAIQRVKHEVSNRNPNSDFTLADLSFVNIAENRREAMDAARPYVVWYWKNAPKLFELAGIDTGNFAKELERVKESYVEHDHIHASDWSAALSRSSFVTDEMVDKFTISGTPEDCVRKLKDKERLGVQRFIARHTGDEQEWPKFLASYCEDVIPYFA